MLLINFYIYYENKKLIYNEVGIMKVTNVDELMLRLEKVRAAQKEFSKFSQEQVDEIFRQAQRAFNAWSELDVANRTTDALLKTLDFDFFELLDSVTIARSRKHIEKYYDTADIGKFPIRKKPISLRPELTNLETATNYNQIYEELSKLSL